MADNRFSALSTDPRYRIPSRKAARTAVDPRFKTLFTDQEFRKKASVDRYGRKIRSETGETTLKKSYRLDKEDEDLRAAERRIASSSEEESSQDEDAGIQERRDPARQGGFSESSSEEESSEEESDEEADLAEDTAGHEQTEDIPTGEVTRRIAAVNLDWDHIRAADIMAVANSFVPQGGMIERVTVYPSEFGKERMEREEIEGPPREIFASTKSGRKDIDDEEEESSEDEDKIKQKLLQAQTEDGSEFDMAKLRQYQLERLRYYYAVISCSSNATSKALYDAMDGREYLTTSNFFDLRFVPDDTSFEDDKPHDECTELPPGYKPNDFRTEALTHSKVRLTWDEEDATRKEVQKRAFSRAEMDEHDLQAYIGSDSSDAESIVSRKSTAEDRRAQKKHAEREKMRAALGLSSEPTKPSRRERDDVVGDMQITFTSGLGGSKEGQGVFENEPQDEESTRARYIRKERERKQRRKAKNKAERASEKATAADADANASSDNDSHESPPSPKPDDPNHDPFDDPFFTDPTATTKAEKAAKKAAKFASRSATTAHDSDTHARRAELALLMAEDGGGESSRPGEPAVRHFDMREIEKAEKLARRKGKTNKRRGKAQRGTDGGADGDEDAVRDDFRVETADPRFAALFDSHEFAIDPTNPRFKGTENMKVLLEEGRTRRKRKGGEGPVEDTVKRVKRAGDGDVELDGLVARLKDRSHARR